MWVVTVRPLRPREGRGWPSQRGGGSDESPHLPLVAQPQSTEGHWAVHSLSVMAQR